MFARYDWLIGDLEACGYRHAPHVDPFVGRDYHPVVFACNVPGGGPTDIVCGLICYDTKTFWLSKSKATSDGAVIAGLLLSR